MRFGQAAPQRARVQPVQGETRAGPGGAARRQPRRHGQVEKQLDAGQPERTQRRDRLDQLEGQQRGQRDQRELLSRRSARDGAAERLSLFTGGGNLYQLVKAALCESRFG